MSKHISFTWDYEDSSDNIYFRLYEDGKLAVDNIAKMTFDLNMEGKASKKYEYYVTAVNVNFDLESDPSPKVTVNFTKPKAPTNLRVVLG